VKCFHRFVFFISVVQVWCRKGRIHASRVRVTRPRAICCSAGKCVCPLRPLAVSKRRYQIFICNQIVR
jgi:hypothetical protein